ncbi:MULTISPECIES: RibD family protein [unclassified Knoellia]|uniref:RibD family protein n=1 Tax=Knoellia altitudinis TaxID=3404795 RepID=UPI00361B168B
MSERPYTVLSCAMSLDGCLDDGSGERLILSNASDLDRVDAVRAACDAILVGAGTVRADKPRLLVRSEVRRKRRRALGLAPSPCKVTVTRGGMGLDPTSAFFTTGECDKLVYCASEKVADARDRLDGVAVVIDAGLQPSMAVVSEDLVRRGVRQLLVEGGQSVHTQFLGEDLADELHVVVAPFFVSSSRAHRIVAEGPLPWNPSRRAHLAEVRQIGDVVLMRYALSERFAPHALADAELTMAQGG